MWSEKKIQAARGGLEIPNDWDQGVFSEAHRLYKCITTDAAAVPDGESKEKQKITSVTMDAYIIVPFEI